MIENLYDKRNGKRVTIYAVGEDSSGYPKFLIREKNRWVWQSAKHYITEEERQHIAYDYLEQEQLNKFGYIDVYYFC